MVDFREFIWATITASMFARLLLRLQNRSSEVSIVVLLQLQIRSFGVSGFRLSRLSRRILRVWKLCSKIGVLGFGCSAYFNEMFLGSDSCVCT